MAALQHGEYRQKRNLTRTQFSLTKNFKNIQGNFLKWFWGYFLLLLGYDKHSCSFLLPKSPQLQGWRGVLKVSESKEFSIEIQKYVNKAFISKGKE